MAIHYQSKLRQHGAATLLVSLLILVGATLIVMFSARTSLMEQRISGNEIRIKQASNAAQAGMDEALAYLTSGGRDETTIFSGDLRADPADPDSTLLSSYRSAFWDNSVALTLADDMCPDAPGTWPNDPNDDEYHRPPPTRFIAGDPPVRVPFIIYSCGWSDDSAARQPMLITAQLQPPLPGNAPAPLIARGMVNTAGRGHIINFYTNLTVWAGEVLNVTGNAGTTFIRDVLTHPNVPNVSIADITTAQNHLPNSCDDASQNVACKADGTDENGNPCNPYENGAKPFLVCTTVGDRAGLDVIMDDFDLGTRNKDEFFQAFMGASKGDFKEDDLTIIETPGASLNNRTGEKIWIDGDLSLGGNTQIGSLTEPVIMVVDGDFTVAGNFTFYGMLYVTGNLVSSGTPYFYGSTIVEENNTASSGTPRYIYDPYVLGRLNPLGPMAGIAGTWRDWLDR